MPNINPSTLIDCQDAIVKADRIMATLTYSSGRLFSAFTSMYQALQEVLIDAGRIPSLPVDETQPKLLD